MRHGLLHSTNLVDLFASQTSAQKHHFGVCKENIYHFGSALGDAWSFFLIVQDDSRNTLDDLQTFLVIHYVIQSTFLNLETDPCNLYGQVLLNGTCQAGSCLFLTVAGFQFHTLKYMDHTYQYSII